MRQLRLGRRAAHEQHQLSARGTGLTGAMCLRDLSEREGVHDRKHETPRLDQIADLREYIQGSAVITSAEPHSVLPRASEVGYRHHVLGSARKLDELGQDTASGDVQCQIDTLGR